MREPVDPDDAPPFVCKSQALQRAWDLVGVFAPRPSPVLLVGPTGSGKEVMARTIHARSGRRGPFVPVNCAALPNELVEGELFGYRRGAFSGAITGKRGLIEAANHGTLLLDELTSMPALAQAKLLRLLEDNALTRLGETVPIAIDVRFVGTVQAASRAEVLRQAVRADLLFRLSGVVIEIPALDDRPDDIAPLAELFAGRLGFSLGAGVPSFLTSVHWQGNVRELRLTVERAAALSGTSTIQIAEVLAALDLGMPEHVPVLANGERDRRALIDHLANEGWNAGRAAAAMGIGRATLFRRLRAVGVSILAARAAHRDWHAPRPSGPRERQQTEPSLSRGSLKSLDTV